MVTKVWRYLIAILLLMLVLPMQAQQFFNLTADEVRVDSVLPRFVYSKPLSNHYQDSIYTATIKYAEYVDMTVADIANYNRLSGAALPSQVPVETQVSLFATRQRSSSIFVRWYSATTNIRYWLVSCSTSRPSLSVVQWRRQEP